MHDIRKKVLIESGKKTSRKAKTRPPDSLSGSAAHSPTTSPGRSRPGSHSNSRHNSRPGSRYASDDEDGSNLSEADHSSRLRRLTLLDSPGSDSDDDSEGGGDGTDGSGGPSADRWQHQFDDCMAVLQDRKRSSSTQARVGALTTYLYLVRNRYAGPAIADALSILVEQLLKSIRRGSNDGDEKRLALQALAVTTLACPEAKADHIFDSVFEPVKRVCVDPESSEACKAAGLQALGVVVLFGGGTDATADELLGFLLEIVETDGQSLDAVDSGVVVTAALQMWTFVASYMMAEGGSSSDDEDDLDEDDEGGDGDDEDNVGGHGAGAPADKRADVDDAAHDAETSERDEQYDNSLVEQSQEALEAFVDQLGSTDTDVQTGAAAAIGLLFEASRKQEAATGKTLRLSHDRAELAQQLRDLARGASGGSTKSMSRHDRRQLRNNFSSVATSLELGKGPKYATAGRPRGGGVSSGNGFGGYAGGSGGGSAGDDDDGDDDDYDYDEKTTTDDLTEHTLSSAAANAASFVAFGYRDRLQVQGHYLTIDSWALSARVDTLRTLLTSGLRAHLLANPLVAGLLHASNFRRLASELDREATKRIVGEKRGKRRWKKRAE